LVIETNLYYDARSEKRQINKTLLWLTAVLDMAYHNGTNFTEIVKDSLLLGDFVIANDMNMQGSIGVQFICLVSEVRDPYFTNSLLLSCQPFPSRNHSHAMCLVRTVCSNVRMCVSTSYCSYNIMKRKHSFDFYTQLMENETLQSV
jgi:hypothetical protein